MNAFRLDGKVAIVTGASMGLGQGIALAMMRAGAQVMGVDYVPMIDTAQKAKDIGAAFEGTVANLMDTRPIEGIVKATVARFGRLDILMNNAGIIRRNDALDFPEKDWDDVLALNLKTVFFFSQAAARQFRRQDEENGELRGGKILSIASMLSYQGGIRVPSYTAAKSAVKGITMSLCNEWAQYNIQVNAIAPGYMATAATQALRDDAGRSEAILDRIPAGRWGTPEDVAGPAVFLASSAADYINGFTLAVDGGWLAR